MAGLGWGLGCLGSGGMAGPSMGCALVVCCLWAGLGMAVGWELHMLVWAGLQAAGWIEG